MSSSRTDKSDPADVAQAYYRYGGELQRFLVGLLRNDALASDALQTTFSKCLERGGTVRQESKRAWLFQVAYREAMLLRRRQTVDETARRRIAWSVQSQSATAEEPLLQNETIQAVRQAIDQLPPEQQQVVRMRIYEEKTFAAIAEELTIPLGTALARMRAALKKLRARLELEG